MNAAGQDKTFNWEFGRAEDFTLSYNQYYELNDDNDMKKPLLVEENESFVHRDPSHAQNDFSMSLVEDSATGNMTHQKDSPRD